MVEETIPVEDITITTEDQDQTMPKPKQPRRDLKKSRVPNAESQEAMKEGNAYIEAQVGGPPVNPSSEGVTPQSEDKPKKTQQTGRGTRAKKTDIVNAGILVEEPKSKKIRKASQKPQDAPGETSSNGQAGTSLATVEAPQPILEALNEDEAVEREQLEYDVDQGIEGAFKVANALLTIREKRLYRSTHATYEEYVEDRFQMSVRRARYLTFAAGVVKSLEDSGVTDLPTNERQVRELQSVVPEDHAKVWERAKVEAKAKGKKEPGRKEVQEAATKVGRSKTTAAQKKVQKGQEKGAIPADSQVTTTEVDEGVDSAMVADIDLPDGEWLAQFPIRQELSRWCCELFDQEALFYRWFSTHRKPLVRTVTSKLAADVRRVAKRVGPYVSRVEKALSLADPRTWKVCKTCNGQGKTEATGDCTDCKTAGYRLG
jgi:hypothetical protein